MDNRTAAQSHFESGQYFHEKNQLKAAQASFLEAVRLDPENAEYLAWLALVLNLQEDYARSLTTANRAIGLDPNCALA
jgi:tetratricopeptide (TPR) repeat protein